MTLFELALILAVIVWGGVYLIWRTGFDFRRNMRAALLYIERDRRHGEDEAWAEFLAQARMREQALTDTLQSQDAVDRLVALLGRVEAMDVVA